jgi:hypothetical protein
LKAKLCGVYATLAVLANCATISTLDKTKGHV